MQRPPLLRLLRPLRTDGSNAFAFYSMRERVPRIARDTIERNADYPAAVLRAIEGLAHDIERNAPLPTPRFPDADVPAWISAHAEHEHETWLGAEWFHAELAFYRELVHACRFWETGRDPFAPVKMEELSGERPWSRVEAALALAGGTHEDRIASLLEACLWGNRVDLSYTVAASLSHRREEDLLVDERGAALAFLAIPGARVHVVADNAGTELALDLALVGAILESPQATVTLHLKMQPMFVSDAMVRDVWDLIERMRARGGGLFGSLAAKLDACFASGRLVLAPDPFWTGPRFFWELPPHLRAALSSATVVVLKGDVNYRRLLGDALWPPATPLARASAYTPAPVVCLRTMKSDPVAGLPDGLAEALDATHPNWRIDGQRALVQTIVP
jgi:damage-control phosphatase, subfamily III